MHLFPPALTKYLQGFEWLYSYLKHTLSTVHWITESLRLEKTSKIIKSNHNGHLLNPSNYQVQSKGYFMGFKDNPLLAIPFQNGEERKEGD